VAQIETTSESQHAPGLARLMGPWLLLLFIVGDLLGTGIYSLTGEVARHVGGAVWLPFLVAVVIALFSACSYLELVTKYPRAAGAAHFVQQAFGAKSLTFVVGFAVMCSGITSASTASRAFAANFSDAFDLGLRGGVAITVVGMAFLVAVAIINYRGLSESLIANVILTAVEASGLLLIIGIGMWALGAGVGDFTRVFEFGAEAGGSLLQPTLAATTLAFFAMIGFEDSVNMVEETRNPTRTFPRAMFLGLGITALIYVLVSLAAVTIVPPAQLAASGETPLLLVVRTAVPDFPLWIFGLVTMFAVANTALLNMMMASRLVYGMSRGHVLPAALGQVHAVRRTPWVAIVFTTLLALSLIGLVGELPALAGTTTLLLMCVFAVVNVAVLVLRREKVEHAHFRTPTFLPVLGIVTCVALVGPWSGRAIEQYVIAAILVGVGVVLWLVTALATRHENAR
jgi:amino acid transporter